MKNSGIADTASEQKLLRDITGRVVKYRRKENVKVLSILLSTLLPFLLLLALSFYAYDFSAWYSLLLGVLILWFYVRLFAVLHDCAHNSFFNNILLNKALGHFIGLFFYTPFEMWKDGHHKHHVNSGNLDKRHENPDVWLMTVREYEAAAPRTRLVYRLFRHPLVYLTLVPVTLFLFIFRLPSKNFSVKINLNILLLNLVIAGSYFLAFKLGLLQKMILIQLPFCILGFITGALMFYLQHQFEESYYSRSNEFVFEKASLQGSSFYKFPWVFNWMTGNVSYHHIHHLNPGIPMYNLPKAHAAIKDLFPVGQMAFSDAVHAFSLKLWDEDNQKMVPFR